MFRKTELNYKDFMNAVRENNVAVVKSALNQKGIIEINPAAMGNYAIQLAAERGNTEIVALLLQDKRVQPEVNHNYALGLAIQKGHLDVIKLLLQKNEVNPAENDYAFLRWAAKHEHVEVLKVLLSDLRVELIHLLHVCEEDELSTIFILYALGENIRSFFLDARPAVIQFMDWVSRVKTPVEFQDFLAKFEIDITKNNSQFLRQAAAQGKKHLVKRLLEETNSDPTANGNEAIVLAAVNQHFEVVKLLLMREEVDPAVQNNIVQRMVYAHGNFEIMNILLQDKRIDPSFEQSAAFRIAVNLGNKRLVRRLLDDGRCDPTIMNPVITAAENGDWDMVLILLSDKRIDPAVAGNTLYYQALAQDKQDIAEKLLTYPSVYKLVFGDGHEKLGKLKQILSKRVLSHEDEAVIYDAIQHDPRIELNSLLLWAVESGHLDITKYLLSNTPVRPEQNDNAALKVAYDYGHIEICLLLIQDDRVRIRATGTELLKELESLTETESEVNLIKASNLGFYSKSSSESSFDFSESFSEDDEGVSYTLD